MNIDELATKVEALGAEYYTIEVQGSSKWYIRSWWYNPIVGELTVDEHRFAITVMQCYNYDEIGYKQNFALALRDEGIFLPDKLCLDLRDIFECPILRESSLSGLLNSLHREVDYKIAMLKSAYNSYMLMADGELAPFGWLP